ncbi:MAG: hypothetical protein HYU36_12495 [Planctomycetes bacterium]|nr:hypothetical protein [Planctomycetota bacterium]
MGNSAWVFAFSCLSCLLACAEPAGGRKPGSDFVLPVTFPMLEIEVEHPIDNLKVWRVDEGKRGRLLFDSLAWWRRWKDSTDPDSPRHRLWRIRLGEAPERIAIYQEGGKDAEGTVKSLRLLTSSGDPIEPIPTRPHLEGGRVCSLPMQTHPLNHFEFAFPKDVVAHGKDDESRWPPIRIGLYYIPYAVSDPSMVPPGYPVYQVKPEFVAQYDWSIPQANTPGMVTRDLYLKVKALNPEHRCVPRLFYPYTGCHLDFHYDPEARAKIVQHVVDTIEKIGLDLLHAVTLSEEENGNLVRGLYWTDAPPDWAKKYSGRFEEETGQKFTWATRQHIYGNREFLEWMKPKILGFYNGLYDELKKRYPKLPVLQYVALNNDGSGISWHEPGDFKADGWVLWTFWNQQEGVVLQAAIPGKQPFDLWMLEDKIAQSVERVRASGVPNAEIYHCGFAHVLPPDGLDAVVQIRCQRRMGIPNSFLFYPLWAMMDPKPGDDGSSWKQGGRPWTEHREALQRVLRYRDEMLKNK